MEEESPEIVTATLAELYFNQGKIQEAIDTYRTLVELNPEDTHLKERREALEAIQKKALEDQKTQDAHVAGVQRAIAILESWRANIREHVNPN
jgi:tetratricopeptide (TPR) repeat protein